jgi:murein DD-endopeptidase MepM/ murein hydrolase activator NlpD
MEQKVAKFFGFTKSGTSLLGKIVRKIHTKSETRKVAGLALVMAGTGVIFFAGTRNIGGNPGLNVDFNPPVVDASTLDSVQKPVNYTYESQGYSWIHSGVDLVAPVGTSVHSIMPGTVKEAGPSGSGYGNFVVITHDQQYESLYGHLSEVEVKTGDKVQMDTEIAKSGSTGFSTGPHVHLEVHYQGVTINPAEIVPGVQ